MDRDAPVVPGAASSDGSRSAGCRPAAWALLPFVWSLWLLLSLVPALLLAPHLAVRPAWLTADAAGGALAAAAAFFLVAAWPFWIAFGDGGAGPLRLTARSLGRSLLELAILLALAVPLALVAWSVSGSGASLRASAAGAAACATLGLGLRAAYLGTGGAAGRWLVAAALLVCAGPLMVAYAAGETMHAAFPRLLQTSPVVGAVQLAMDGWPAEAWDLFAQVLLWPAAGAVLLVVGLLESRRRRLRGKAS
jgi:hypothetical protein